MLSNVKLTLGMALIMTLAPIFIRESSFIPTIMGVQIFLFVVYTGTSLQADESSKWSKFEITLPVKRKTIINAKYVSSIILIAIGVLISTLTAILSSITISNINTDFLVFGYCFGLTLSINTVAFMYPIILKIGAEKNELILLLACGFSLGVMLLTSFLLSLFNHGIKFSSPVVGITSVIVSVLLLVLSYFLSIQIHRKKEF
jgi:ABC-type transport system involved in multi-copper enzyme maturation permease subunit